MKPLLFFVALLLSSPAQAQQINADQVPPPAFAALQKLYPRARQVQWERAHGLYEASFHQDEAGQSALFSNNGDLEETASDRSPQSLPAPVRPALGARYPGLTVSTAANLLNAHTGAVTYDAKLLDNASVCTVLFEADGHEVRKARKK